MLRLWQLQLSFWSMVTPRKLIIEDLTFIAVHCTGLQLYFLWLYCLAPDVKITCHLLALALGIVCVLLHLVVDRIIICGKADCVEQCGLNSGYFCF